MLMALADFSSYREPYYYKRDITPGDIAGALEKLFGRQLTFVFQRITFSAAPAEQMQHLNGTN